MRDPNKCRHIYISTLIASGLNMKAVSVLAGHASITIAADRYGHLFAGHEDEAGRMLDGFYARTGVPETVASTTTEEAHR